MTFESIDDALYLNLGNGTSFLVSKSYSPTPDVVVPSNTTVRPFQDIRVPYTITEASQGTALRLFIIDKAHTTGDEWFCFEDKAVYLATGRSIRGFERRWMTDKTFGELFLECCPRSEIEALDPNYSYTFFLRHMENDILRTLTENYVHLCCMFDLKKEEFVHPTDERYIFPTEYIRKPITVAEVEGDEHFMDEEQALIEENKGGWGVVDGHPLLFTFFCGDHLVSVKYFTLSDHNILSIRTLNNTPFKAWILGQWLEYPGLKEYKNQFISEDDEYLYNRGIENFQMALRARYYGKIYKIPINIYKSGIQTLVEERRGEFTEEDFIKEGLSILRSSVVRKERRMRVLNEFLNRFIN